MSKNNNSSINSRLIYLTERKESKLYFILTAFNNTSYLNQQTVWFRPFVLYFTRLSSRRFRSYSFFTVWLKKNCQSLHIYHNNSRVRKIKSDKTKHDRRYNSCSSLNYLPRRIKFSSVYHRHTQTFSDIFIGLTRDEFVKIFTVNLNCM